MKFDKRIVAIYGTMMVLWTGFAIWDVLIGAWAFLFLSLVMIGHSGYMMLPALEHMMRGDK